MKIKKVLVGLLLSLFMWQSVADAASISTRVRILESKVAKQNKVIKDSAESQKDNALKVDRGLAKIQALEKKLSGLLKDQNSPKKAERRDKRYAYP
ncbi:hypothetical protein [Thiomicrorhabdus sp.]|uniref:hypothetical protein n=1 Tax=Thiomicrorhabdus sp. TaxID=2039724 RepID=UPI002AA67A61|nr:hypothetical protein [Thiomicrorhabdus sp.]